MFSAGFSIAMLRHRCAVKILEIYSKGKRQNLEISKKANEMQIKNYIKIYIVFIFILIKSDIHPLQ